MASPEIIKKIMETNQEFLKNPHYQLKKQGCGYTIAIILAILHLAAAAWRLLKLFSFENFVSNLLNVIGLVLSATFFILALHKPDYLAGNPPSYRLLPLNLGLALVLVGGMLYEPTEEAFSQQLFSSLLAFTVGSAVSYFFYISDDSSPRCCSCMKPWVYVFSPSNGMYMYNNPRSYTPQGHPPSGQPYYSQQQVQAPYQAPFAQSVQVAAQAPYGPQYPPQQAYPAYGQQVYAQYPVGAQVAPQGFAPHPQMIQTPQTMQPMPMNPAAMSEPNQTSQQGPPPQYQDATRVTSSYGYYGGPKS